MSVFKGVFVGEFLLHSGDTSPVLFDVMQMITNVSDRKYILNLLDVPAWDDFDTFVGIEFGGAILAAMKCDSLIMWSSSKKLGFYRKDGSLTMPEGAKQRVVLIDDVVTTGSSMAEAEKALKAAGHKIVKKCSVIQRGIE